MHITIEVSYDFQWFFYPLVFLRIIGQYTFSSFVLSNTALTIIMILFSKKCFIVVHFSLSHSLSRIVLGRKKGDREIYVPANSSLFICFFGLSENHETVIQRCVITILENMMRLLITPSYSFHSLTLLLLLQWLALMDFFIALLYCNMISSSDLEHIVRINCHTARREGLKNEKGRMKEWSIFAQ